MYRTTALFLLSVPLWGQDALSLPDAIRTGLAKHPSVAAAQTGVRMAETRIREARSGYLPKLTWMESWQRSDNPVFVFSSLLTQHQFTERNFAIGPLNRPDALNNFQSQLVVEQALYDAGQTKHALRSAELGKSLAGEDERRTEMETIARVVRTYYGGQLAGEFVRVADEAVRSAEADLQRAVAVRSAGMATDADVLSIRVHLAAMREQQIRRAADLEVAQAALNEALGLPLETRHTLTTALSAGQAGLAALEEYEKRSLEARPEVRQSRLAVDLAQTQAATARSALLPQVLARGTFEADRERFVNRGGANWFAGVTLRWNLFNGYADKARIEAAGQALERARALEQQAASGVRLQVRRAHAHLKAAQERVEVARAAVSAAEESLRITKNRYENGLSTVTDLLRTETALLDARTRQLAAIHDLRLAGVGVEYAAGTLQPDSEVLR